MAKMTPLSRTKTTFTTEARKNTWRILMTKYFGSASYQSLFVNYLFIFVILLKLWKYSGLSRDFFTDYFFYNICMFGRIEVDKHSFQPCYLSIIQTRKRKEIC